MTLRWSGRKRSIVATEVVVLATVKKRVMVVKYLRAVVVEFTTLAVV